MQAFPICWEAPRKIQISNKSSKRPEISKDFLRHAGGECFEQKTGVLSSVLAREQVSFDHRTGRINGLTIGNMWKARFERLND